MPDHVVGEVTHGAALEARQTRHRDGLELAQQPPQRFERITVGKPLGTAAPPQRDPPVFRGQHHVGIAAEKRVARPLLAPLHRLEQEGIGAGPQPEIGRQRGVEVRRQLGEHGNEVSPSGELAKLVA